MIKNEGEFSLRVTEYLQLYAERRRLNPLCVVLDYYFQVSRIHDSCT